jgi:hypothetical protein
VGVSTAGVVDFTVVDFTGAGFTAADLAVSTGVDLVASTLAGSTVIAFTMAGSTTIDFAIAGFSLVERSHIPGGAITRIMAITITASPTPRRLGTIVLTPPAITLM